MLFAHMYNVNGDNFWSGQIIDEVDLPSVSSIREVVEDWFKNSPNLTYELVGWSEHDKQGSFSVGPLGGLILVRVERKAPKMTPFQATAVYEQSLKNRVERKEDA